MDYQVVVSVSARADLQSIVHYISFDAPDRVLRFGQFLMFHTKALARFPELGRVVPEFDDALIREIIVRSYRIVYRLDHSKHLIEVIRFWHASRGIPEINLEDA
jgi:toxin ParE1/3/4